MYALLLFAVIVFLVFQEPYIATADGTVQLKNTLYVDIARGKNTEQCWSGVSPCKTLDYAATVAKDFTDIFLVLPAIHYSNLSQELFSVAVFHDLVNITISSYRPDTLAVVQCYNDTGLKFVNVTNLLITYIRFLNCGSVQSSSSPSYENPMETLGIVSAIYLLNCTQVTLQSIACISGPGTGVAMYDVSGEVVVDNCVFENNGGDTTKKPLYPGGSGLYIEHTACSVGGQRSNCDYLNPAHNPFAHRSLYKISGCTFVNNCARTLLFNAVTFADKLGPQVQRLGWGGGLTIAMMGAASNDQFHVDNCTFSGNSAPIGGAISFQVNRGTNSNNFIVSHSLLKNNIAQQGGGGIHFGYLMFNSTSINKNTYYFYDVTFSHNTAMYGGGTAFYSTRALEKWGDNQISFTYCTWDGNRADVGAAVALFPEDWALINGGYLPVPNFENCNFSSNVATSSHREEMLGVGVVFSDQFSMNFYQTCCFLNNHGSAIYITAGRIYVQPMAFLYFVGNYADRGAAASLMGYAGFTAYKETSVIFKDNYAVKYGGAIYYGTIDKLDYVNSRRCFIRYYKILPPNQWETLFGFINNTAGVRGHSIYSSSLLPCARATLNSTNGKLNPFSVFRWSKQFFYDPVNRSMDISTDSCDIIMNHSIQVFPGLRTKLPLIIKDELQNNISTVFETSKNNASCDSCDISGAFEFVSDKIIQINGDESSWINFTLRTISDRQVGITVLSNLSRCPLGYVLDENELVCVCSTSTDSTYDGIVACNETNSQAILKNGYWAGCSRGHDGILLTAPCPLGYCAVPSNASSTGTYLLSQECAGLDDLFCQSQNRSGPLCGSCAENFTVFYHSDRFRCSNCTQPAFGIPLYIVSELLPLTALFIIVILFGVSLTSGAANSFILFAQVLDLFEITAFGDIHFPETIKILTNVYRFAFGFLNFDFFQTDSLSFCLFEGATVLDILAFKYVTAVYGIMLIVVLALLMRFCSYIPNQPMTEIRRGKSYRVRMRQAICTPIKNSGHAIIHGIAAFFIITYSQLSKVSLQILTKTTLRTKKFEAVKDVVFLSGSTDFLSLEHLKYALPAVLVLAYTVLIPLVLILHPLYYLYQKVRGNVSVFKWQKHGCLPSSSQLHLLFKPFFDEFQSCFRDSMRFFGGLYFVYRLAIAACMAFSQSAIEMYGWLEVALIIMLTIHAVCQPYEKRFFNILDSLIFACLAIINGISLSNYANTLYRISESHFTISASIQLILVYAPILYMVTFVTLKVLCRYAPIKMKLTKLNQYIPLFNVEEREGYVRIDEDVEDGRFDDTILPARMFDARENNQEPVLLQQAPPPSPQPPRRSRQRTTYPGTSGYGATGTNNA